MRLFIKLCRHCKINPARCKYRADLKAAVNAIAGPGTLMHNCKKYYRQLPTGTRVVVQLNELDVYETGSDDPYEPPGWEAEWIKAGLAMGTISITECRGGFFCVTLDKPVTLCLPPNSGDYKGQWLSAEPVKVERIRKRACDIEILN